jgi:hypothetical protein
LYLGGEFTEMTFRTPFENLIRQLNPDCDPLHEPHRKKKIGAPDFSAKSNAVQIGYTETKNLHKNLEEELEMRPL